ncbi:MAG TPA: glycosyltransferase, partial [Candidatus Eisenbacteria bacterium]|nr:glycosyltransferase [Candidatus Eisenbacteria bacterium]
AADLLVLLRPNLRTMVPGQLYEYLDAGRPLHALLPAGDEAEALVRRAGGGVTPPGDRAALARALETRYTAWRDAGRAPDARPAWVDEFQRARLAARLARLLDGLSGGTA